MSDRAADWLREIASQLADSAAVLTSSGQLADQIAEAARRTLDCLLGGHKLLLCGNGGSSADALHVATELTARYARERRALPAIALGADPTFLTAVGNDYDFDRVFARQVEALGAAGDILWALTTSGNSPNVLAAVAEARRRGLRTIGFSGQTGGKLRDAVELCLCVQSTVTARIQEAHIAMAHIICDLIDAEVAAEEPGSPR